MANALRSEIEVLASTFAAGVVAAIRSASLADILSMAEGASSAPRASAPPLPRKPAAKKAATPATGTKPTGTTGTPRETVLAYFRVNPGGTGATGRKALGMERGQWGYTVASLLETKGLRKEGERGQARYWAVG